MPHFSAFFGVFFAVQMQMCTWQRQDLVPRRRYGFQSTLLKPHIAQNIQHDGWAVLTRLRQRQLAKRADLQLELRDIAGVYRVMAAVVRARGDFVDDPCFVFK